MNQVGIVGRLTKDPVTRVLAEGRVHTSFILAVQRSFRNQHGDMDTDFILCSTWGRSAHNVSKYCAKGSLVAVSGRLQSRHYDKEDGTRTYVTEVVGDTVRFLDKRQKEDAAAAQPQTGTDAAKDSHFDFQPPEPAGAR